MRLVFVIYSLQAGGAERVLSIMANYWSGKGHTITLVTLEDESKLSFYKIDPRIKQVSLGVAGASQNWFAGILNNLGRIYKLRRAIRSAQADAVISFMTETNVITLLASVGLQVPVIVTEHTDPWTGAVADAWSKLRRWLYPRAARVVVLNERAKEFFKASPHIHVTVLPNPVVIESNKEPEEIDNVVTGTSLIVAMGRLSREKRFDLLISAYSQVAEKYPDWVLMILGEGPERRKLEILRDGLGLESRVMLPGTVRHPHAVINKGEIFVSSSDVEGFPMALCEAMACGVAVISTEYHSGVRDIIEDRQNGILVPPGDPAALAAAMMRLIKDPRERELLAENAVEIRIRFSVDAVMAKWEKILNEIMLPHGQAPV